MSSEKNVEKSVKSVKPVKSDSKPAPAIAAKPVEQKESKSEKKAPKPAKDEKTSVDKKTLSKGSTSLQDVMVRISAENAEYVKMESKDGWYIATGKPRVPDVHKDIKTLLSIAVKRGCALFATSGGIRVMKNANGEGGIAFIEFKNMTSGNEVFLFSSDAVSRKNCEAAGLTVTRESGSKGVYVSPKMKNGDSAFDILREKFSNNHRPQGWMSHPWQGYEVHPDTKRPAAKKPPKKEVPSKEKVMNEFSGAPKKKPEPPKNPVLFMSNDNDEEETKSPAPVRQVKKEKKVDKKTAAAV